MLSKLGVATNANDILARFWASGKYEAIDPDASEATDSSGVKATCSPAMDILVSSNFERLMWYLAYETVGNDAEKASSILSGWMGKMKADGKVEVEVSVLEIARRDFCAERVGDDEVSFVLVSLCVTHPAQDIGNDSENFRRIASLPCGSAYSCRTSSGRENENTSVRSCLYRL